MRVSGISPRVLTVLLILALLLSACDLSGSAPDATGDPVQTIPPATLTAISLAAEDKTTPEPEDLDTNWADLRGLEIDFWYLGDQADPGTRMNAIVDRFNQENEWGIKVTAVDQGQTHDPLDSIETALTDGLVPDLMLSSAVNAADWHRRGYTVNLMPYLNSSQVGLSSQDREDYYPGIMDSILSQQDLLLGLPFTQTFQVIYYNQSWAAEMGFSFAPATLDELTDQICRAAEDNLTGSGGVILYPEPANIIGWLYAYQGNILESGDGGYHFSSPEMLRVTRDWHGLISDKCGSLLSRFPNPMAREIEFEGFNQRQVLVVMSSVRNLDLIQPGANSSGRADEWTMLPFLGPDGTKVVPAQIQAGMIFKTTPEEQLAAWLFLKYLTSPRIQAEWVQHSFDYPTRKDSLGSLRDFRSENPDWAKGANLLKYVRAEPMEASWNIVGQAVGDAFEVLLLEESSGRIELLAELDRIAQELQSLDED